MTAEEKLMCFQFLGNDGFIISDFNLQKTEHYKCKDQLTKEITIIKQIILLNFNLINMGRKKPNTGMSGLSKGGKSTGGRKCK